MTLLINSDRFKQDFDSLAQIGATGDGGVHRPALFEINGEKGAIRFNLERLNELEVFWVGEAPKETQGFHNVLISEGYHPFWSNWWPHGHIIGWEHTFVHEIHPGLTQNERKLLFDTPYIGGVYISTPYLARHSSACVSPVIICSTRL